MSSPISTRKDGNVLIITSDSPPVNALSAAVREGLHKGMQEAAADDEVEAVVVRCDGRTFFAGADITEFGKAPSGPGLGTVIDAFEDSDKPVVAAIHGTAFGGGLEVALGCHYRVAVPSAQVGLPEVKLGIIPGAAGTQRLPRLIGAEAALPIIANGDPVRAPKAEKLGIIDKIVGEDSLEADAIAFARSKVGQPIPRTREGTANEDGVKNPAIFDEFRHKNARRMRGLKAPEAGIQAVKAAGENDFEAGVKKERELFAGLAGGDQARALQYYFFAERKAAKIDDIDPNIDLIPVKKVGIIGAGTMGGGIAMNFLSAGYEVVMLEREQEALDRGTKVMKSNYDRTAQRGRMTEEQVDKAMGLLSTTLEYDDLADCDLIIEAVFENMEIKKEIFKKLDETVKQGAILGTNTSGLDVNEIANATSRPEAVLGLHFFSPANVMKLLEIVRGDKTADDVLATSMKLAKKIGKVAVVSGVCRGFIGNRILGARQRQSQQLIMEGAKYWEVDDVLLEFGFPMGPFQMSDLAGLDIGWHRDPNRVENIRDALCAKDRRGQKTGAGYYDYDEARNRTPSEEVQGIIKTFAEKEGYEQRDISKDEIRQRLLYPMVNEGALILEEGISQRGSDIDVVWVNGYGWPIYRGGPMFWADQEGLDKVVEGLEQHRDKLGKDFKLADSLKQKAAAGERIS